jgi:hypothetical protein
MAIQCSGSNLTRRFKIYAEPNTGPIDPTAIAASQDVIRPVVEILRERLVNVPTVANPANGAAQTAPATTPVTPYVPAGGGGVPAYQPGSTPKTTSGKQPKQLF